PTDGCARLRRHGGRQLRRDARAVEGPAAGDGDRAARVSPWPALSLAPPAARARAHRGGGCVVHDARRHPRPRRRVAGGCDSVSARDIARAFVPHGHFRIEGAARGPLAGLTFVAKDLYDVAGHPTGAGNPTWLATHSVPDRH